MQTAVIYVHFHVLFPLKKSDCNLQIHLLPAAAVNVMMLDIQFCIIFYESRGMITKLCFFRCA